MIPSPRGFALVISIVLISVVLSLGAALLDLAYKQVLLSSTAKNSQIAFYNADSALECALYWDQQEGLFNAGSGLSISDIRCNNTAITAVAKKPNETARFEIPCPAGGATAQVVVFKDSNSTDIYTTGYSSCDATLKTRIERGFKIHY